MSKKNLTAETKKTLITEKMREIMEILDLDLKDPSLSQTPARIAKMYVEEIFTGLDPQNFPQIALQEEKIPNELVLVKNISFVSFCEHHFVPMIGKAHVAYYPSKQVIGLSKVHLLVRHFAKRPQLQERLTQQIADALATSLKIEDVAVVVQAMHFCVVARGVEDKTSDMETQIWKGRFEVDQNLRNEFFSRIS